MKNWTIEKVSLNVNNLEKMTQYYTEHIGLQIKEQRDNFVSFGLLELHQIESKQKLNTTGLYHFALLVPSEKDLAEILIHLIRTKTPITGAANHGYSQALYLDDPEGNGIEIYADRDVKDWDIRENGEIVGFTKELDVDTLLSQAQQEFSQLPELTRMGHVHLKVNDLNETQKFYENLGFELKSDFGQQAKFFAVGLYHHHIGTNTWYGKDLEKMKANQLGLREITLRLNKKELPHEVLDPSGIPLKINFE